MARRDQRAGGSERQHRLPRALLRGAGAETRVPQVPARPYELRQSDRHAERRQRKAPAPAEAVGEPAHQQRPDQGPEIDAHVEDREPRVAARAAFGIERGHHDAGVGFEQADADRDHEQPEVEDLRAAHGQHEIAGDDQHCAAHHRALRAEQPVGDPAAEEAEEIGAADVHAVDVVRGLVIKTQATLGHRRHHEQDEDPAHAVVGEPFPHLGEEQGGEAARLAEDRPGRRGSRGEASVGGLIHEGALSPALAAACAPLGRDSRRAIKMPPS